MGKPTSRYRYNKRHLRVWLRNTCLMHADFVVSAADANEAIEELLSHNLHRVMIRHEGGEAVIPRENIAFIESKRMLIEQTVEESKKTCG